MLCIDGVMEQHTDELFGELRSVIHDATGEYRWHVLVPMLTTWPEEHLTQVVIPYLHDIFADEDARSAFYRRDASQDWFSYAPRTWSFKPAFQLANTLAIQNKRAFRTLLKYDEVQHFKALVGRVRFTHSEAKAIAESPNVKNLRHLYLDNGALQSKGITYLAHSPHLHNLTHLSLAFCWLRGDAQVIGESETFSSLKYLQLSNNNITDDVLLTMARSQHMSNLEDVNFRFSHLTSRSVVELAQSPHITQLKRLILSENPIGDDGPVAIVSSEHMQHLDFLEIFKIGMSVDGLERFLNAFKLKSLKFLSLAGNKLGSDGARLLASTDAFKDLETLDIRGNDFDEQSLELLHKSEALSSLNLLV